MNPLHISNLLSEANSGEHDLSVLMGRCTRGYVDEENRRSVYTPRNRFRGDPVVPSELTEAGWEI